MPPELATTRERFVTIAGLRTRVVTAGDAGPPVVLLHGGICDTATMSWGQVQPELGRVARTWSLDLPGYGESEAAREPMTLAFYGRFVHAALAAFGLRAATLAGSSMGGFIALETAFAAPALVDGLVLVGTGGLSDRFPFQLFGYALTRSPRLYIALAQRAVRSRFQVRLALRRMVQDPALVTDSLVAEVMKLLARDDTLRAFCDFGADQMTPRGLRTNFAPRLAEIPAPVLIVHGARDYFYPESVARAAAGRLRRGRLEIVPDCGHWVSRERPEVLAELMTGFLRAPPPLT